MHLHSKPYTRLPDVAGYRLSQILCNRMVYIFPAGHLRTDRQDSLCPESMECCISFLHQMHSILFLRQTPDFWNHSKTSPLTIARLCHFFGKLLCLTTSFRLHNSRIAVYKERFSLLKFHQCNRQCCKKLFCCKTGHNTTYPLPLSNLHRVPYL